MKFLIDTNIFLEVVLAQSKATDAQELLSKTEENEFFVSDYSLHSIGLLFFRRKQYDVFQQFLTPLLHKDAVESTAPAQQAPSKSCFYPFEDNFQRSLLD